MSRSEIACTHDEGRTRLGPDWLPFAPGTRRPLPEDLHLEPQASEIPPQLRDPHPDWELIELPPRHRVPCADISPDNRFVATDGVITAFATPGTRRLLAPGRVTIDGLGTVDSGFVHSAGVLRWSPDSTVVVGQFWYQQARQHGARWFLIGVNVASGQPVWAWPRPRQSTVPRPPVPGTSLMAIEVPDGVRLFDATTGETRAEIEIPGGPAFGRFRLGVNGTQLLVDRFVEPLGGVIYDVKARKPLALPPIHSPAPRDYTDARGMALSPDGRLALLSSGMWGWLSNTRTGKVIHRFGGPIHCAAADLSVVVWREPDPRQGEGLVHADAVDAEGGITRLWSRAISMRSPTSAYLSCDASLLMIDATFGVEVYRMHDGELLSLPHHVNRGRMEHAAWVDDRTIATEAGLFDSDSLAPIRTGDEIEPVPAQFSAPLAGGGLAMAVYRGHTHELRIRRRNGDRVLANPIDRALGMTSRSFVASADGSCILVGQQCWSTAGDGAAHDVVWLGNGLQFNAPRRCAAITNDGRIVAIGHADGRLAIYRAGATATTLLADIRFRRRELKRLAFAPDDEHLAVEFVGSTRHKWVNARRGRVVRWGAGRPEDALAGGSKLYLPAFAHGVDRLARVPDECGYLSPDGERMLVVWMASDRTPSVLVYRRVSGDET